MEETSLILQRNVLTLKEVAEYLRLPEEKIEKQVLQGNIPRSQNRR